MFQKARPSASTLPTPKKPLIITQLKLPNGIQYTSATQRCLIEILLPGQKKYACIEDDTTLANCVRQTGMLNSSASTGFIKK